MKWLLTLALILYSLPAWATTTTFQDGVSPTGAYAGEVDALINNANTNEENTNDANFNSGSNPRVIYFDLTSIPTNATVTAATLTFRGQEVNCTGGTSVKITAILNPDNSGAFSTFPSAQDNFNSWATWANKHHQATTVKWSVGGGAGNFTDVNTGTAEATISVPACTTNFFNGSVLNMVKTWVANPNANGGAFFTMTASVFFINGQFNATAANHPQLSVTYTIPHYDLWNGKINGSLQ